MEFHTTCEAPLRAQREILGVAPHCRRPSRAAPTQQTRANKQSSGQTNLKAGASLNFYTRVMFCDQARFRFRHRFKGRRRRLT